MSRQTVLLLFGGESSEHEISILSARNVYAAMDNEKYDVKLCYIDKNSKWWLLDGWKEHISSHGGVQASIVPGSKSLVTIPGNKVIHIDVILPILHGKNGEDGVIQGLASILRVPIVGPSLIGAAITMDKDVTKRLIQTSVPVAPWKTWFTYQPKPKYEDLINDLGPVLFIKPSNAGSSMGASKVRTKDEYDHALNYAAEHDSIILIEEAISGFEVQISVLGNENPSHTDICEIESVTDFHDFEDKYSEASSAKFHIPARLSNDQTNRIKKYALEAYHITRCRGLARVDFFVVDENTEYLNEINTIPGFTNVSVYPKLWHEAGMKYSELIDELIKLATR